MRIREIAKLALPPIILMGMRKVRSLSRVQTIRPAFEGPVSSWAEAERQSDGWDAQVILDKTLDVSLKVKRGDIVFQQDTVVYDRIRYSDTILAFLTLVASANDGAINIVDFGGSLGTNFFQNRHVLKTCMEGGNCAWSIIERKAIVNFGRKHFQNEILRFFETVDEARRVLRTLPRSVLFSGSLQCLENPYFILDQVIGAGVDLLAFDRLLCSPIQEHEIYIQNPDPHRYYAASYPVWCFSRTKFIEYLGARSFELIAELSQRPELTFNHAGMIFRRMRS